MEGRVEVCTSYSSWGTICNKQWTPSHTRVVCRNLGYSDAEGSSHYQFCLITVKFVIDKLFSKLTTTYF